MFVWKDSKKRCNPFTPYTDANGARYHRAPSNLYEEVADPVRASEDTHYNQEIDDAPYLVSTPKSAEQIDALWWNRLKARRDSIIEHGGCNLDGKWFHSDVKSQLQQLALTVMGNNLPANLQWKTMDGSFVTMTPDKAAALFVAQVQRENQIFEIAEQAKLLPFSEVVWPEVFEQ